MWTLYGLGITLLVHLCYQNTFARILPQLTPLEPEKSSTEDTVDFLDHISASKLECLLQYVEQAGNDLPCVDKFFGDERSKFLLAELQEELGAGAYLQEAGATAGEDEDRDGPEVDDLVADLNTLSGKVGPVSTVNDDVPIINSDKTKRVDEQIDTPKQEEQRGYPPKVTAEVVKTDEVDNDDNRNKIDTVDGNDDIAAYEYDSSLVSKLYNMLQDLVLKETFDYGLNMNEDDNDSDEEEEEEIPVNMLQNTMTTQEQQESDSEEDNEEDAPYANELNASSDEIMQDDNDDEIEQELKGLYGAYNENVNEDAEDEEDIDDIENDLVRELDKMLSMAKEAAAAKGKAQSSDDLISSDKFLTDLRNMEKSLKELSD